MDISSPSAFRHAHLPVCEPAWSRHAGSIAPEIGSSFTGRNQFVIGGKPATRRGGAKDQRRAVNEWQGFLRQPHAIAKNDHGTVRTESGGYCRECIGYRPGFGANEEMCDGTTMVFARRSRLLVKAIGARGIRRNFQFPLRGRIVSSEQRDVHTSVLESAGK